MFILKAGMTKVLNFIFKTERSVTINFISDSNWIKMIFQNTIDQGLSC